MGRRLAELWPPHVLQLTRWSRAPAIRSFIGRCRRPTARHGAVALQKISLTLMERGRQLRIAQLRVDGERVFDARSSVERRASFASPVVDQRDEASERGLLLNQLSV